MINTVVLMGRLTYEPELRKTPSSVSVLRFQLAVERSYQKNNEEKQTDFIDCVAWRQTAEFISKYFHKGNMLAVEGAVQTNNYTDKNGANRKQVEVLVNNASFCGSKNENGAGAPQGGYMQSEPTHANKDIDFEEIVDDDDLPF